MEPGHLGENAWHLKPRHPFVPVSQQFIRSSDDNNRSAAHWADHLWNAERLESTTRPSAFIPYPPLGIALLRTAWVQLNCLCVSFRCFCSCLQSTKGYCSLPRDIVDFSYFPKFLSCFQLLKASNWSMKGLPKSVISERCSWGKIGSPWLEPTILGIKRN